MNYDTKSATTLINHTDHKCVKKGQKVEIIVLTREKGS